MDKAETLRGLSIAVPFKTLESLPPDSFYHFELIGFEVLDPAGQSLGHVAKILSHPAVDSLLIENGEPKVIPLSNTIVQQIDRENRQIILRNTL